MIDQLIKKAVKLTVENAALIYTGVGVAGTVTTGVFAAKGGIEAEQIMARARIEKTGQEENVFGLTLKEKTNLTWKCYIPAGLAAGSTIAAIVMLNRVGTRQTAAMAAAWAVSEKSFTEYREKVAETFGEKKEERVRDDVAQDRVTEALKDSKEIIVMDGKSLVYDMWSGRTLESTMEDLKHAHNRLNAVMNSDGYVSLNEYYDFIGLPRIKSGDDVGWNSDSSKSRLVEISYSSVLTPDQKPAIAINFRVEPAKGFQRFH